MELILLFWSRWQLYFGLLVVTGKNPLIRCLPVTSFICLAVSLRHVRAPFSLLCRCCLCRSDYGTVPLRVWLLNYANRKLDSRTDEAVDRIEPLPG